MQSSLRSLSSRAEHLQLIGPHPPGPSPGTGAASGVPPAASPLRSIQSRPRSDFRLLWIPVELYKKRVYSMLTGILVELFFISDTTYILYIK
jgi:hypothetical protein